MTVRRSSSPQVFSAETPISMYPTATVVLPLSMAKSMAKPLHRLLKRQVSTSGCGRSSFGRGEGERLRTRTTSPFVTSRFFSDSIPPSTDFPTPWQHLGLAFVENWDHVLLRAVHPGPGDLMPYVASCGVRRSVGARRRKPLSSVTCARRGPPGRGTRAAPPDCEEARVGDLRARPSSPSPR